MAHHKRKMMLLASSVRSKQRARLLASFKKVCVDNALRVQVLKRNLFVLLHQHE